MDSISEDCYHQVDDVKALAEKLEKISSHSLERLAYDMDKYDWNRTERFMRLSKFFEKVKILDLK